MTRIAALYDIHGNLPALDAVLAAVDADGVDDIVIGGDVVLGPMPRETLDRLIALGSRARFIRGNCDRLVVDAFDGRPMPRLPASVQETIAWTAAQLDQNHRDVLATFPETLTVTGLPGGDVLFCHASPRRDDEILTVLTPVARLRPMLAGVTAPTIVCGHTHMPFDRTVDHQRVINAGSVGMPYGLPGAYWLLMGPDVQPMRTDYNLARAAEAIRQTAYPQAPEFASRSVLHPESEQAALALFEPTLRPADAPTS